MVGHVDAETLDRRVEVEQYGSRGVVAHHALYPEERRQARAPGDRLHRCRLLAG
jgi:hypothetical protein